MLKINGMLNSRQKEQDIIQKEQVIVKDGHTHTHIIISFQRSVAYQGISLSQPKYLQRYINANSKSAIWIHEFTQFLS